MDTSSLVQYQDTTEAEISTPNIIHNLKSVRGQRDGEDIIFHIHKHWWFLLKPGWPGFLALLALLPVLYVHLTSPQFAPFFFVLEAILLVTFIIFVLHWLYTDLNEWWFDSYVLTSQRVIQSQGLIDTVRKEAPLDKIQQVVVYMPHMGAYILNYGNVIIYTAGSSDALVFYGVGSPRRIQEQIQHAIVSKPATPAQNDLVARDPSIARAIKGLSGENDAENQEVEKEFDEPELGPSRRFGGPLRLRCRVSYLPGERTIEYIQHHPWILMRNEALPLGLGLLAVLAGILFHISFWQYYLFFCIAFLCWITYVYIDYSDDVYIVTNQRLIDIDRQAGFFFESGAILDYDKIQDLIVKVPNITARSLDYGNITITSASSLPAIEMVNVPNPLKIQDMLFTRIAESKKHESNEEDSKQKSELKHWFTTVFNELPQRQTPNLLQLSIVQAMVELHNAELSLKVYGEISTNSVPPGHVLQQNPLPGTYLAKGSEVHVTLSTSS